MSVEILILFLNIFAWLIWPLAGALAGLIIGWQRIVSLKSVFFPIAVGYLGGLGVVGLGYLALSIWGPMYHIVQLDWASLYSKYVIQIVIYFFSCLGAAYLVRKCRS